MFRKKINWPKIGLLFLLTTLFGFGFSQPFEIPQKPKAYKKWLKTFEKRDDGLYIRYLTQGKGVTAKTGDYILVHYTGKLADNTIFDSSLSHGEPLGFNVNVGQVIKGWDKILLQAPEGSKLWLIVPPDLGYGNQAIGVLPPNSTLYFEIEVLRVIPQKPIEPYEISGKEKIALSNGIEYVLVKENQGVTPDTGAIVTIHFTAFLPDGSVFDSSIPEDKPEKFVVGAPQILAGINLAVQRLSKGSKARFFVPSALAFGEKGYGNLIPPNTDVIFDIEMLEIKAAPTIEPFIPTTEPITLDNGVYFYPIVINPDGIKPKEGEIVSMHYSAYFEDGTLFDSSVSRDEPIMFMIGENHILPGLEMVIVHMSLGDKTRVFIPYPMAYGEEGNPPVIPPRTNLIFDIEVVDILRR